MAITTITTFIRNSKRYLDKIDNKKQPIVITRGNESYMLIKLEEDFVAFSQKTLEKIKQSENEIREGKTKIILSFDELDNV